MGNQNIKRQFPDFSELAKLVNFRFPAIKVKNKRLEKALTIWDLREIAQKRTPKGPFDYTDGSSETESSLNRARQTYSNLEFHPSILVDVSQVKTSCLVLGHKFELPFGISPTGFTRMMNSEGELAGAKAASKFGIPFTLSALGTSSIEEVVNAVPNGVNWFQLYMWKDRERSLQLIELAKKSGVTNLFLTVDVPVAGARLRDTRNGLTVPPKIDTKMLLNALPKIEWWTNFLTSPKLEFAAMSNWDGTVAELLDFMFDASMTFEDLKWIRSKWDKKLTIKGIQTLSDAKKAADYGVDAIVLSNHGGRQLDRGPVPLLLLPEVAKELKGKIEIHIDTGIMHGADILAAIALGADFAYVGRAYLYGLMAGGQLGVERALEILSSQLIRNLKLLGVQDIRELNSTHVSFFKENR